MNNKQPNYRIISPLTKGENTKYNFTQTEVKTEVLIKQFWLRGVLHVCLEPLTLLLEYEQMADVDDTT